MEASEILAETQFRTRRLLAGLRSALPGGSARYIPHSVQPKSKASALRYYSLWMRHLIHAEQVGVTACPKSILELGSGDSLGAGLSALLSGADQLYAIDRFALTSLPDNVSMFDELVSLFVNNAVVDPTIDRPHLPCVTVPATLLDRNALDPERLRRIRSHLCSGDPSRPGSVIYDVSPNADSTLPGGSVDFAFSHSVLEYIEDPEVSHHMLFRLLKPGGVVSHFIDYSSIGFARRWDGHWAYSDLEWQMIRGKHPYVVQRIPHSTHTGLLQMAGFENICVTRFEAEPETPQSSLAKPFKQLSEEDRRTRYALIQARKPYSSPVVTGFSAAVRQSRDRFQ